MIWFMVWQADFQSLAAGSTSTEFGNKKRGRQKKWTERKYVTERENEMSDK